MLLDPFHRSLIYGMQTVQRAAVNKKISTAAPKPVSPSTEVLTDSSPEFQLGSKMHIDGSDLEISAHAFRPAYYQPFRFPSFHAIVSRFSGAFWSHV